MSRSIRAFTLSMETQVRLDAVVQKLCEHRLDRAQEAILPQLREVPVLDAFNLFPQDYPTLYAVLHQPVGISAPEGLQSAIRRVGKTYAEAYYAAQLALKAKNKETVRNAKKANKAALRAHKFVPSKPINFSRAVETLLILGMDNFESHLESNAVTAGSTPGHAGEAAL